MTSGKLPFVSIIIPVYNGSNYMREAIDSALAQTYMNCEVVVINDGSSDEGKTETIANCYGDKIRYFSQENGGISSALNTGIANMRGEYFSWLSHDDVYFPEKIERQVTSLMQHSSDDIKTMSLCNWILVDQHLKPLARQNKHTGADNQLMDGLNALDMLFRKGTFNGCALLIPKAAFDECGLFDASLRFNQDSDMWYRLFLKGYKLVFTGYLGVKQRMHNAQLTQKGNSIFHCDCLSMSKYLIPELLEKSTVNSNLLLTYAFYNARYNNSQVVNDAINVLKKAGLISPVQFTKLKLYLLYGRIRPMLRSVYHRIFTELRKT